MGIRLRHRDSVNYSVYKRLAAVLLSTVLFLACFPDMTRGAEIEKTANEVYGYVDVTSSLSVRTGPGTSYGYLKDSNGQPITLYGNQKITILSTVNGWHRAKVSYNGKDYTGYVSAAYVNIYDGTYDEAYAKSLKTAGFPDSYINALCFLHSKHPKWIFTPYKTGLDWQTAVSEESKVGRSLIPNSSIASWLSTEGSAYSWEKDKYTEFDSGGWVAASKELVEYYLDPRNFLSERGIFMFNKLTYNPKIQTEDGVKKILSGTFMEGNCDEQHTYSALFMEAAEKSGVSPYALATKVRQEQGVKGTSGSISGTVKGYEGFYNYFNWGAYKTSTMSAIQRGLWFASQKNEKDPSDLRPWDTKYKALIGGSIMLGKQYINRGQNTIYLEKFNVTPTSTYGHQYMTNVQGAASEANSQKSAYENLDLAIEFSIPVFNNMTAEPAGRPTAYGNPNAYLSSLSAGGVNLTPSFSYDTLNYTAVVDYETEEIKIDAKTVSSKATVSGTGTKTLNAGRNVFDIVVTAENGNKKTYRITISRSENPIPTPSVSVSPSPSGTVSPSPSGTVSPSPSVTDTPSVTVKPTSAPTPTPTKEAESVTSSVYAIKGSYITDIDPGTTVGSVMSKLTVKGSSTKKITNTGGTVQENNVAAASGMQLRTDSRTYVLCVNGDIYGDGKVDARDLLYLKKGILGAQKFNAAQNYAACVSDGSKPNARDLLLIKKYILGAINKF